VAASRRNDDSISSRARTFQLEQEVNRIRARGTSNVQDEIRTDLNLYANNDEAFRFAIEYRVADTSSGADTSFEVRVFNYISFSESGVTPGYQPAEDSICTGSSAARGSWTNLPTVNAPTNNIYEWTTENTNGLGHTLYLLTDSTPVEGISITPNQLKFDVSLDLAKDGRQWPRCNSVNATHVAFRARMKTDSSVSESANSLSTTGSAFAGQFKWLPYVTTPTSAQLPLVWTQTTEGTDIFHYFTVNAAQATVSNSFPLVWDPIIGINAAVTSSIALPLYCGLLALAAWL